MMKEPKQRACSVLPVLWRVTFACRDVTMQVVGKIRWHLEKAEELLFDVKIFLNYMCD